MFKFSTTYINVVSLFISIIVFSFIQLFFSNYKNFSQKSYLKAGFNVENQNLQQEKVILYYFASKKIPS